MINVSQFDTYNAEQIYKEAFQLFMRPYPDKRPGEFLGNDQRLLFAPYLMKLLGQYSHCRVLDVGAGSGETADLALRHVEQIELYIEEPNGLLLEIYRERIQKYPHIQLKSQFQGTAQDLIESPKGKEWFKSVPSVNVILMVHMLYYLDARAIEPLFKALFKKLEKGGQIFVVFAEQPVCTTARASRAFFENAEPEQISRMEENWNLRMDLFERGKLKNALDGEGDKAKIHCHKTPSRMYGKSIEELALMCFIGEMGMSTAPFKERYEAALKFIQKHSKELDLRREDSGPRAGFWSTVQPQLVYEIHKT